MDRCGQMSPSALGNYYGCFFHRFVTFYTMSDQNLNIFANLVNGAFVLDYFQLCIDVFLLDFGQKWNKEGSIH